MFEEQQIHMSKHIEILEEETGNDGSENPELDASIYDLKKRIDEEMKKSKEYLDDLQRTRAEFENYRKRTEKEKKTFFEEGRIQTLIPILSVADSINSALKHIAESNGPNDSLRKGLELINRQMVDFLNKEGIKKIETVGSRFNPEFHEAVATECSKEVEEGMIIEELQAGYIMNERLLRPSMVKVVSCLKD